MRKIQKRMGSSLSRVVFLCLIGFLVGWGDTVSIEKNQNTDEEGITAAIDSGTTMEDVTAEDDTWEDGDIETAQTIPMLHIYLNGVSLEEINNHSKNIKYGGNRVSLNTEKQEYHYTDVEVKGRGNATWGWKKKPYQIQFPEKVDLFGLGASKKWVLLANYRDVSLLRNEAAFYLANGLGEECVRPGRFVELYVNDAYIGLYYLTHKVEIGSSVVELQDEWGALVEIEAAHEPDDIKVYSQCTGTCLVLGEAVEDDNEVLRQGALESFAKAFDRLESAARIGDWAAVQNEIDVESFVRYFLVNEFSANPDGFVTSFYMYRDGENDVIHAGPVWDFDMAFANPKYTSGDASSANRSWAYSDPRDLLQVQEHMVTDLFQYMMDIPEFRAEVEEQYQTVLRASAEKTSEHLYIIAERILDAALKDQKVWHSNSTFLGDLDKLTNWITARLIYMDLLYGSRIHMEGGVYKVYLSDSSASENIVKDGNTTNRVQSNWYLEKQSDGTYRISDSDTGLVLSLENEESIQEYEPVTWKADSGSCGQRWILAEKENGVILISKLTGLVLSFSENTVEMNVQEYQRSGYQTLGLEKE